MGIIEEYDIKSRNNLKEDENISEYEKNLDERITYLSNFKANNSLFKIISHPIKIIIERFELKSLKKTKTEFQKALDASLVTYMEEECGILDSDLTQAMLYSKPKYLRQFMAQNPVKKLTMDDKKH